MSEQAHQVAKILLPYVRELRPKIGLVLGSGLGEFVNQLEQSIIIPYAELPGFPECHVAGHAGKLHIGTFKNKPIICLQGRTHYYEGASHQSFKTIIRSLKLLGCETLILTNAAGTLHPEIFPGELVLVTDHINFQFSNPLVGPNDDDFGERFVSLENAYDPNLREQLKLCAAQLQIPLHQGIYIAVLGPSFETPAEIRAYRLLGADLVGMSTVPEVIIARHCQMRVAVISTVTNFAVGLSEKIVTHEVTLENAKKAVNKLIQLLSQFIQEFRDE